MLKKGPLSEQEKIQILTSAAYLHSPKHKLIGEMMNRSPNTVKNFYNQYQSTKQLSPKRGRPPIINEMIEEGVIGSIKAYPKQTLDEVSEDFEISPSKVKSIFDDHKIQYFSQTPVVGLDQIHKDQRIQFCSQFDKIKYHDMPKIIFTDESTVRVNEKSGGIWRERGIHCEDEFYTKNAHPPSVMVWGGIGPHGYKTPLIRFGGQINSEKYCSYLISNGIFNDLSSRFGNQWVWQQDNAPCHTSKYTTQLLSPLIPKNISWPPKSTDLSPIEQVWDYMKSQLCGRKFINADSLYNALCVVWSSISENMIHSFYSSFLARCQTCLEIKGECLNGHWNQVHEKHNEYRTQLKFITNPYNLIRYPIEF